VSCLVVFLRLCREDGLHLITAFDSCVSALAVLTVSIAKLLVKHCSSSHAGSTSIVQLCSVLILCLSANAPVCVALDRAPLTDRTAWCGVKFETGQTLLDAVILLVLGFVREADLHKFQALQKLGLSALVNMSFHYQRQNLTVCTSLVALFSRFASVKHSTSVVREWAGQLLQFFSNVLRFTEHRERMVYAIVRCKSVFESLGDAVQEEDENDPLRVCLLCILQLEGAFSGLGTVEDILAHIASADLVLPTAPQRTVTRYARSETIDQVIRKCFWLDLYRSADEYWDFWRY
jgi:hypothetical protein